MQKGWWQLVAVSSLAINLLVSFGLIWALTAYSDNLSAIADGQPVCMAGYRAFDSIAAAQAIGRLDVVSFMMTAGGLFLGFFAFIGFWMIRREALDEAKRCAMDTAAEVAAKYYAGENKDGTLGGDKTEGNAHIGNISSGKVPLNPSSVSVEGAREETGAGNGQL